MSFHDRNTAIVAAVAKGDKTFKEIGDKYGLTKERIRQIAVKGGLTSRKHPRFEQVVDPKVLQRALDLYARGMPVSHIAEAVGVNRCNFDGYLIRHGLRWRVSTGIVTWTRDKDALLKERYGKYPGAVAEIAKKLKTTRNSVIGRAHRLGLARAY